MFHKLDTNLCGICVYAVIFRDSVEKGHLFTKSVKYIMAWTHLSERAVMGHLSALVTKEYISKKEYSDFGRKRIGYYATDIWKRLEKEYEIEKEGNEWYGMYDVIFT